MATSEPLVPTGREQGARQETEAAMEQAGIPKAPSARSRADHMSQTIASVGAAPDAAIRPARADFDPIAEATPEQFGFLDSPTTPDGSPSAPQSLVEVFGGIAARSNNGMAQAIAARLAERAGGGL